MKEKNMKNQTTKTIYNYLIDTHFNYYLTVYYEYIFEAIENTKKDFKNKIFYTIEDIHKNIKENYI